MDTNKLPNGFRYAILPAALIHHHTLTPTERLLMAVIHSLDGGGGCTASNAYLACCLGIHQQSASRAVSRLVEAGLVERDEGEEGMRLLRSRLDEYVMRWEHENRDGHPCDDLLPAEGRRMAQRKGCPDCRKKGRRKQGRGVNQTVTEAKPNGLPNKIEDKIEGGRSFFSADAPKKDLPAGAVSESFKEKKARWLETLSEASPAGEQALLREVVRDVYGVEVGYQEVGGWKKRVGGAAPALRLLLMYAHAEVKGHPLHYISAAVARRRAEYRAEATGGKPRDMGSTPEHLGLYLMPERDYYVSGGVDRRRFVGGGYDERGERLFRYVEPALLSESARRRLFPEMEAAGRTGETNGRETN